MLFIIYGTSLRQLIWRAGASFLGRRRSSRVFVATRLRSWRMSQPPRICDILFSYVCELVKSMRAHNEHAMLNCQTNSLYITIFANCFKDPCILLLIERMNCLEAMSSEFVGLYHFVEKTNHFVEKTNHSAEQKNRSLAARATSLEPRATGQC